MKKRSSLIRNSFQVFLHDVKRLFHAPAALVVAIVLLILPSLYAWYNVVGFWNPYDKTGNLEVCVVNEDDGGSNRIVGDMNIGDMVVEELKKNDQLKWEFVDRQTADETLKSGNAYAAFVIPSDFTKRLIAITEGSYESPTVSYIINEKSGPVSPKITDAGATTLDETINSAFVSSVSAVAVDAIDSAIGEEKSDVKKAKSAAMRRIDGAHAKMSKAQKKLDASSKALDDGIAKVKNSRASTSSMKNSLTKASKDADALSKDLSTLQTELGDFSEDSWPLASSAITAISKASQESADAAQSVTSQTAQANAFVESSSAQAEVAIDQARSVVTDLRQIASSLPQGDPTAAGILAACKKIEDECNSAESTLSEMKTTSSNISESQDRVNEAAESSNASVQNLTDAMQGATSLFFGRTAPAINSSILLISESLATVNATIPAQKALLDELDLMLKDAQSALENSKEAIDATKEAADGFAKDLEGLKTDVASILSSGAISKLIGKDGLDAKRIAEFMGSPTEVKTESFYSPNAYGASMAPLFMNLTFWIGAFMLIVIMRQEVYYPKIKNLTAAQSYLGRFLLFACMAVLQAAICCVGLVAIGVGAASMPALVFASCMTSLSYLSIIYALSLTLQYVGKGICVLLIFAQIPGATGLYPVEMTSPFFQAIYPLMPFTYGIEAMRESICGFYGLTYLKDMVVLGAYFAIFMVLGMVVRPLLANVSRMESLQVHKSGIYNGEKTLVPPRPFRFSQVVRLLADKDEYKNSIESRYQRFEKWYPRIIKGSIIVGLAVPVGLVAIFALTPTEKVVILTIWLVFLIVLFTMLIIVESLKNSLKRQLMLEGVSNDQLLGLFGKRSSSEKADDGAQDDEAEGGDSSFKGRDAEKMDVSSSKNRDNAEHDVNLSGSRDEAVSSDE